MVRAKRATTGIANALDFPTAAAVAEEIHDAAHLIRDRRAGLTFDVLRRQTYYAGVIRRN
jgi:hypothetical protein